MLNFNDIKDYQQLWYISFLIKKVASAVSGNEEMVEELHKPVIENI